MTTLDTAPLAPLLADMFAQAEAPPSADMRAALSALAPQQRAELSGSTTRYREFYDLAKDAYLAVSRETGQLLYLLARTSHARNIVEFGTSFGVSTLHLAAGLRDGGGGRIITTEFEPSKAARAREHFATAGLDDLIELREGDALHTLATGLPEQIDLLVLDGAKGLYPQILELVQDHMPVGALLLADNADASPDYLRHVRSPENGYLSLAFADDVELSLRTR